MGQKQRRLVEFRGTHIGNLAEQDRKRDRYYNAQNNKDDIKSQRIADDKPGILGPKQEFKVSKSNPVALKQVGYKSACGDFVIFKRNDNPEHWQKGKKDVPHKCRQRQQSQFQIVSGKAPASWFYGLIFHVCTSLDANAKLHSGRFLYTSLSIRAQFM